MRCPPNRPPDRLPDRKDLLPSPESESRCPGHRSPRAGEMWNAYCSLSDRPTRQAFLRTLRSVVDYRGQAVSALGKIHVSHGLPTLLIWGEEDRIIPVAHGHAAHDAVPGSRLEVLPGVGHFPHVEAPTAVVDILDDFIATTGRDVDLTIQQPDQKLDGAAPEGPI